MGVAVPGANLCIGGGGTPANLPDLGLGSPKTQIDIFDIVQDLFTSYGL